MLIYQIVIEIIKKVDLLRVLLKSQIYNLILIMNKIKKQKGLALSSSKGFTLIEILVVIGIIAILAAVVLIAINPARQFAQARDSQRVSNLNAILNAVGQRIADHKGLFRESTETTCTVDVPGSVLKIASSGGVDLRPCLVPTYLSELPIDPKIGSAYVPATGAYDTGYHVYQDGNGRIHVSTISPAADESSIPRTSVIEIVR